jgi:hypothetical protein
VNWWYLIILRIENFIILRKLNLSGFLATLLRQAIKIFTYLSPVGCGLLASWQLGKSKKHFDNSEKLRKLRQHANPKTSTTSKKFANLGNLRKLRQLGKSEKLRKLRQLGKSENFHNFENLQQPRKIRKASETSKNFGSSNNFGNSKKDWGDERPLTNGVSNENENDSIITSLLERGDLTITSDRGWRCGIPFRRRYRVTVKRATWR